jgi:hypothetical protein
MFRAFLSMGPFRSVRTVLKSRHPVYFDAVIID